MTKVMWNFSMSMDGFVAGPEGSFDWLTGVTGRAGVEKENTAALGAVLGGRRGWDQAAAAGHRPYGDWPGPVFVLTHHADDAEPADGVTFLDCDAGEAVAIARAAVDDTFVEVHSSDVGRQLLERGLIDEITLYLAPVLLGDGVRLFDNPGGAPVRLERLDGDDPFCEVELRLRPAPRASRP